MATALGRPICKLMHGRAARNTTAAPTVALERTPTQTQTAAPVSLPFPCVPWSPRPPLPQLPPLKRAAIGVGTPECLLRLLQAQATSLAAQEPRFLWLWVGLAARQAQDGAAVMSHPPAASPFICTCTTCNRTSSAGVCPCVPSGGYPREMILLSCQAIIHDLHGIIQ